MADSIQLRPITELDIGSFHAAVDAMARESRFLRRPEAPGLDAASEFVRGNIGERSPQFVALDGEALVGWCDIVRFRNGPELCVLAALACANDRRGCSGSFKS